MPKFTPKIYVKDESFDPIYRSRDIHFYARAHMLPTFLMGLGALVLITQVIFPLMFFTTNNKITKPVSSSVLGIASGFRDFKFNELQEESQSKQQASNVPTNFYMTIPKLGIKDAVVETNSLNLSPDNSLGHYNGSSLPGEVGNAFIYGHSVLPWFYNPNNYKTIFSTIDKLSTGDEILVKYNNKTYTYKVENQNVLAVDDVKPLAEIKPGYLNDSTLVLMTCWPAGTKSKRLLVSAVLEKK